MTVRDLDLEGFLRSVRPERVERAAEQLALRLEADPAHPDLTAHRRLLELSGWVAANTGASLEVLRGPAFYDPQRHHQARLCLATALRIVSAANGRVRYDISNATYDVDGVDPSRLGDLERVTADPGASLFEDLYDEVLVDLSTDPPDVVGLSILNRQQIIPGLRLARRCRDAGHRVVLGGSVYAKFAPELTARPRFFEQFCEAVVPYEGETALLRLVQAAAAGDTFVGLPNVLAVDDQGRVSSGPTIVEDVPCLPTPDFDGLPIHEYLTPEPVLPILTGKGCYFNRCKFCDIPAINSVSPRAYRVRKPEQIAEDVVTLWRRHGVRHFEITDEALSPALLGKLAVALADVRAGEPGFDPRFVGYARFETGFTAETCALLHAAGIRKLFFGLESGSQEMLDHMDKGMTVEDAHTVLRNCDEAGIAAHVFSIVGFPEETEAQARKTLQFFLDSAASLEHPRHSFDIHPFGLDLRTEYGDHPERYGVAVDRGDLEVRDFPISIRTWKNTRGLGAEDAALLIEEFTGVLRTTFSGSRRYPDQLWPGFEEYAVLYCSHFEESPFPWRLHLPEPGSEDRFRLVWSPGVMIDEHPEEPDHFRVRTLDGDLGVPSDVIRVLGPALEPETADGWADAALAQAGVPAAARPGLVPTLREVTSQLLAIRALWMEPAMPASASVEA